jgi:hypothetical protein
MLNVTRKTHLGGYRLFCAAIILNLVLLGLQLFWLQIVLMDFIFSVLLLRLQLFFLLRDLRLSFFFRHLRLFFLLGDLRLFFLLMDRWMFFLQIHPLRGFMVDPGTPETHTNRGYGLSLRHGGN